MKLSSIKGHFGGKSYFRAGNQFGLRDKGIMCSMTAVRLCKYMDCVYKVHDGRVDIFLTFFPIVWNRPVCVYVRLCVCVCVCVCVI